MTIHDIDGSVIEPSAWVPKKGIIPEDWKLTGNTRFRISFWGKVISEVEYFRSVKEAWVELKWHKRWRDAKMKDIAIIFDPMPKEKEEFHIAERYRSLTGNKRYRISRFGKVILQVEFYSRFERGRHLGKPVRGQDIVTRSWRDAVQLDLNIKDLAV